MKASPDIAGLALADPEKGQPRIMVLLVDDQIVVGEAIRRALVDQPDVEFHYCGDPDNAADVALKLRPTVILQDLVMPGVNGLDLVRRYRATRAIASIPVIVLSTKEEATVKRDAFLVGADDYLVKLPDAIELVARIRYHSAAYLARIQRDEAYRALRQSQQELMETNLELQRLTNVDGLTGLSNRRYFNEYIENQWRAAQQKGDAMSVVMIDIDHFKQYNDHYGHLGGDEVLQKVAATVKACCERPIDLAARFGGEEFVIVLPLIDRAELTRFAAALPRAVEALNLPHAHSSTGPRVTISVGAATARPKRGEEYTPLIQEADRVLYEAKDQGRNRAIVAG